MVTNTGKDRKRAQTVTNQQTTTNHQQTPENDHQPSANDHKPPANDHKPLNCQTTNYQIDLFRIPIF